MTDDENTGSASEQSARRILLDAARSAYSHPEFSVAARTIFDSCKSAIGAEAGYVALLSADGTQNEVLFLDVGGHTCTVDPALPMPLRGLRERALTTRRVVCENRFSESDWLELKPQGHMRLNSVLLAPLVIKDRAAGIIGLANKQGGFDDSDAELAASFAKIAAIALENAGMVDELRRRESELRTRLDDARFETAGESAKARAYLDAAGTLMVGLATDGSVLFANRAACELLESRERDLVGRDWAAVAIPAEWQERARSLLARLTASSCTSSEYNELPLMTPNGERLVAWRHTVVCDEHDRVVAMVGSGEDVTAARQAERALREVQERLGLAVRAANVGLWDWNLLTSEVYYSTEWKLQLGYGDDEIPSTYAEWEHRLHPEDVHETLAAVSRCIEHDLPGYSIEFRLRHKDGSYRWILSQASRITDRMGRSVRMLGAHIDITERKRSERASEIVESLHEFARTHTLEELLRETLDQTGELLDSPIGFYHFVDSDEQSISLQAWSTATIEHFCQAQGYGLHYDISQGGVWVDAVRERRPVVHNDYASLPHRRGLPEGHATVIREVVVPIFRGDRIVAILGVGNKPRDYDDDDVRLASHIADVAWEVAARKRTHDALSESEERFRLSMELSPDAVFLIREGKIVFANAAGVGLLGAAGPDDVIGTDHLDWIHPDWREAARVGRDAIEDGEGGGAAAETRIMRLDGSTVPTEVTAALIHTPQGPTIEAVIRDVTLRKAHEQEIERHQHRLSELAADLLKSSERERHRVAVELHDGVGQALAAAKLSAQSIAAEKDECPDPESCEQLVAALESAIEGVRAITSDLSPPLLHAFGLGAALERLAEGHLERYGLVCDLRIAATARALKNDSAVILHRAATELLNNAQRHSGVRSVHLDVSLFRGMVTLRVEDRGRGFDVQMFEREDTARDGFGLFSIREEISLVGGTTVFDSAPGRGTRVEVSVPADLDWSNGTSEKGGDGLD